MPTHMILETGYKTCATALSPLPHIEPTDLRPQAYFDFSAGFVSAWRAARARKATASPAWAPTARPGGQNSLSTLSALSRLL